MGRTTPEKKPCVSSAVRPSTFLLILPLHHDLEQPLTATGRPRWEDNVEFTRPARKAKATYVARPASRRVSETIIRESRPSAQYIQAPARSSKPIIRTASPPRAPSTSPVRIEVVSVEETRSSSPRTSRVSVSNKEKSRRGNDREDVEEYIERERIRERLAPVLPSKEEYETYRYVEAPREQERAERRRSRSITYETNPRLSGRLVERERVVVEDGGRRREYYRRP